jgi:hypothetical protein
MRLADSLNGFLAIPAHAATCESAGRAGGARKSPGTDTPWTLASCAKAPR